MPPKKKSTIDKALEQVTEVVDEVTHPDNMSREDYKEFLGALAADIQIRLEAAEAEDGDG